MAGGSPGVEVKARGAETARAEAWSPEGAGEAAPEECWEIGKIFYVTLSLLLPLNGAWVPGLCHGPGSAEMLKCDM